MSKKIMSRTKTLLSVMLLEITPLKVAIVISVVLLTSNLSAIVDSMLHPEIPYFDEEHLIVGGAYALLVSILFLLIGIYYARHKQEEDEIKGAKEEWERTFDAITEPIMILNLNHKIVKANKAMADKLGVTPLEAQGLTCYKAVHGLEAPHPDCPHSKLLADGQVHTTEIYEERLGGYFIITVSPIYDPEGRLTGSIHAGLDITERKKMEEKLRMLTAELELKIEERTGQLIKAQEELARKERLTMIGQLAGGVGHELRNPLGVISNAVYFLKSVLSDADETVKEYLNIIKDEVDNSQRIISDLLDLSRTNTPHPRAISVEELVRLSLAKSVIPENIAMLIDLPDTLPYVLADPRQMGQVFQNIITNALQAMPEGGSLQIQAEEDIASRAVKISITDSGKGISPENIEMLFQPLFTTKARGIGLGLVISRRFAEANNGKLDVESREGKGATFTVTLPVADEAEKGIKNE
ncbi:MAG: ATP-binding protein [Nitrospirota bacterium]